MSEHKSDAEIIKHTHNTARFFTETRHVSWVLLFATVMWGVYGYFNMPQRKDPDIPIRQALVLCAWPGATAEKIEELVTRRIEEKVAENVKVDKIESNTRTGVTAVYITLVEGVGETGKEFDDIKLKLDSITDLPQGAGPINFIKDFGDTSALMLTVASPRVTETGVAIRARAVQRAIEETRAAAEPSAGSTRITLVQGLPAAVPLELVRRPVRLFADAAMAEGLIRDARVTAGVGYVAVDAATDADDATIKGYVDRYIHERLRVSEFHPDSWPVVVVRNPADTQAQLATSAGDKYTFKELDDYTDLLVRAIKTLPMVSKVTRTGLLDERVYLEYSQERLASYGIKVGTLDDILGARNITLPGGLLEVGDKNLTVDPSGEFKSEAEIGDVLVPTANGRQVYLRDLVTIGRGYESPARFYNFFSQRTEDGSWRRSRAVTLAIQMRAGQKIGEFGKAVDAKLEEIRTQLPEDLVFARTSDQPRQVEENIELFMEAVLAALACFKILAPLADLPIFVEMRGCP